MKKMYFALLLSIVFFVTNCAMTEAESTSQKKVEGITKSESIVNSASPVNLKSARQKIVNLGSAILVGFIEGNIELSNLAYNKDVEIHYSLNGNVWQSKKAYFVKMNGASLEEWKFTVDAFQVPNIALWDSVSCEFAVKYSVNGVTYWDNNNGSNYKISTSGKNQLYPQAVAGIDNVVLNYAQGIKNSWPAYANSINYSVVVNNISSIKNVSIIYTTDNWVTTYVVPLSYEKSISGTNSELWSMNSLVALNVPNIEFAVSLDANGVTYWDNNETNNYLLSIPGSL